ncbi:MAG: site-2 protease family protein [Patescibacteria group bacterium]
MPISELFSSPMLFLAWLLAIVFVITIHEFSHALMATFLGDSTAKDNGRLTLNPLSHVSLFGLFMLVLIGFGWGNPVPYNPYNLKNRKFGPALVALAGPLANLVMAIICLIFFKLIFSEIHPFFAVSGSFFGGSINLGAVFLSLVIFLNLVLLIFNLLPIPPLDGSKILFSVLPDHKFAEFKQKFETQGPFILLILIFADNFLGVNVFGRIFAIFLNFIAKII